jgi:hypothetical protein
LIGNGQILMEAAKLDADGTIAVLLKLTDANTAAE